MKKLIYSLLFTGASLLALEPNKTYCKPSGICVTLAETVNPFTGQLSTVVWVQTPNGFGRAALSINSGSFREVVLTNKQTQYVLIMDFVVKDITKVEISKIVESFQDNE